MKYLNRLRPFYFFFAFILGIVYVFLVQPGMRYITKHPTPENAGQVVYQEKDGTCFIYKAVEIQCPQDKSLITNQPITVTK